MTLPSALEGHAVLLVVDGIGYLLPAIRPDMPPRLRRLLGLRREATIKGRCPSCSATATGGAPLAPRLGELIMEHEAWCPVADDTVGPLLARYWRADCTTASHGELTSEPLVGAISSQAATRWDCTTASTASVRPTVVPTPPSGQGWPPTR